MKEVCRISSLAHLTWFAILTILVFLAMASGHISMKFTEVEL